MGSLGSVAFCPGPMDDVVSLSSHAAAPLAPLSSPCRDGVTWKVPVPLCPPQMSLGAQHVPKGRAQPSQSRRGCQPRSAPTNGVWGSPAARGIDWSQNSPRSQIPGGSRTFPELGAAMEEPPPLPPTPLMRGSQRPHSQGLGLPTPPAPIPQSQPHGGTEGLQGADLGTLISRGGLALGEGDPHPGYETARSGGAAGGVPAPAPHPTNTKIPSAPAGLIPHPHTFPRARSSLSARDSRGSGSGSGDAHTEPPAHPTPSCSGPTPSPAAGGTGALGMDVTPGMWPCIPDFTGKGTGCWDGAVTPVDVSLHPRF